MVAARPRGCPRKNARLPTLRRGRCADEAPPSLLCALAGSGCQAKRIVERAGELPRQPVGCGIAPGDDGWVGRVPRRFDGPCEESEGGLSGHGEPRARCTEPHISGPSRNPKTQRFRAARRERREYRIDTLRAPANVSLREVASLTSRTAEIQHFGPRHIGGTGGRGLMPRKPRPSCFASDPKPAFSIFKGRTAYGARHTRCPLQPTLSTTQTARR